MLLRLCLRRCDGAAKALQGCCDGAKGAAIVLQGCWVALRGECCDDAATALRQLQGACGPTPCSPGILAAVLHCGPRALTVGVLQVDMTLHAPTGGLEKPCSYRSVNTCRMGFDGRAVVVIQSSSGRGIDGWDGGGELELK